MNTPWVVRSIWPLKAKMPRAPANPADCAWAIGVALRGPIQGISVADFRQCLVQAGQVRLLPIAMTTLTTIGGLLPLAGVGNFGTLETGWALGFAAVGVPTEDAVASAFAFSVITVGYAALTAALGWLTLPRAPAEEPATGRDSRPS